MKIAVRMDDITPDMNWDNFSFFRDLFDKAGITPLLGIVPKNSDKNLQIEPEREDFYEIMKGLKQEGYVLAMHGYQHLYTTKKGGCFPLNHFSEFAGVPYEQQKRMLADGKRILSENGIETDIFMAPAHSYDNNTLKALKEVGFTKLTDGFGTTPYLWKEMVFYPISFRLAGSLKKQKGYTTLVIHANTINDSDRQRYTTLFAQNRETFISYEEYLRAKPVKRGVFAGAVEYGMANIKHSLVSIRG